MLDCVKLNYHFIALWIGASNTPTCIPSDADRATTLTLRAPQFTSGLVIIVTLHDLTSGQLSVWLRMQVASPATTTFQHCGQCSFGFQPPPGTGV